MIISPAAAIAPPYPKETPYSRFTNPREDGTAIAVINDGSKTIFKCFARRSGQSKDVLRT